MEAFLGRHPTCSYGKNEFEDPDESKLPAFLGNFGFLRFSDGKIKVMLFGMNPPLQKLLSIETIMEEIEAVVTAKCEF